ncbi:MAG: isoaspartyl peptidase/L-asparaginase [Rhodothermales bacterium]
MKNITTLICLGALLVLPACTDATSQDQPAVQPIALAIHGGAGTILRENMTSEREAAYQAGLNDALDAGYAILESGGSSMDAVVAAVQVLEENPLFNAGRGAVYTSEGTHELDAAIMDGATRNSGAVAGLTTIKSPIALARLVMDESKHVMMMGDGAEVFADGFDVERVDNTYFNTDFRYQQLERAREREQTSSRGMRLPSPDPELEIAPEALAYGTVGAVAVDRRGNLAAATSTGGMTNKRFGRVGDVPVIGAGTYADNATAAISATGHGEYFIRGVVAHDIASMMRYTEASVDNAARTVVMDKLTELGGTGGIIAVDAQGNVTMPFNTAGMYRGAIDADGNRVVRIYED